MGLALAEALINKGAEVTLVLGPSQVEIKNTAIKVLRVESSDQMYEATLSNFIGKDIVICSAAVADYKVAEVSSIKIKKKEENLKLDLVKTKDILKELGKQKQTNALQALLLKQITWKTMQRKNYKLKTLTS